MMIKHTIDVFLCAAALVSLCIPMSACTGDSEGAADQATEAQESYFTDVDVQQAAQSVTSTYVSDDVLSLTATVDTGTKTVYLDMIVASEGVEGAADAAENAARTVSSETTFAALTEAENRDDVDAAAQIESWMDVQDTYASGLGRLYEVYGLAIHVDNSSNTLDLDGIRQAGTEGSVNWQ